MQPNDQLNKPINGDNNNNRNKMQWQRAAEMRDRRILHNFSKTRVRKCQNELSRRTLHSNLYQIENRCAFPAYSTLDHPSRPLFRSLFGEYAVRAMCIADDAMRWTIIDYIHHRLVCRMCNVRLRGTNNAAAVTIASFTLISRQR